MKVQELLTKVVVVGPSKADKQYAWESPQQTAERGNPNVAVVPRVSVSKNGRC